MRFCISMLAWSAAIIGLAGGITPVAAQDAATDSVETLHERLKREGAQRFDPELLESNRAFQDSVLASLDSLGLVAQKKKARFRLGFDFNFGERLWNYNRVEGLVAAGGFGLTRGPGREPWATFQGGYAFGSEKFRHFETLEIPIAPEDWGLSVAAQFGERAVPYGSNRPRWNSLRAFVGGEDAQEYLGSLGGAAFLHWRKWRSLRLSVGYEAAEETSVGATTEFALFGDMAPVNIPVEDGTDRAFVARLRLGSLSRHMARLDAEHRVAGGGIGGSFTYNRTDLDLTLRRYFWRQELVLRTHFVHTGGDAPVQRLADVGGLSTVRGWKQRAQVGESSLAGRLEYLVPYDVFERARVPILWRLQLQLVPWADAARTWDGASDVWITSAGMGIQHFLGDFGAPTSLRFDVAFPMGPDRSRDVRLELHFVRGVF